MGTDALEGVAALPDLCPSLLRLFHAADCFPRGGLFTGFYAASAAVRYEKYWLNIMGSGGSPPLDVAFAWWGLYGLKSSADRGARQGQPCEAALTWKTVAADHPLWPPPAPGSASDATVPLTSGEQIVYAPRLAASMSRFSWQLHTWLRPHFLDQSFLERARTRYERFLALHADHPAATLVPTADIALMWHTHVGMSSSYAAACRQLYGQEAEPWRPDYVDLDLQQTAEAYSQTAQLYAAKYGEPYDGPETGWVSGDVAYPLAAPTSPIAFALNAFDENPQQAEQQARLDQVAAVVPQAFSGPAVPRAGAHGLYLAWLASGRAMPVFGNLTCGRCCMTSSADVRQHTLAHTITSLVSVSYFLELPAWDSHPYMKSIDARKGLWQAGSATGPPSFSPSDPERYLCSKGYVMPAAERMAGLSLLLSSAGGGGKAPPALSLDSAAPLWVLLARPAGAAVASAAYKKQNSDAAKRGVGVMRQRNLQRRNSHDAGVYYGSGGTGYYTASPAWYWDGALGGGGYYGNDHGGGGYGEPQRRMITVQGF
ncbi:hypothetical protein TSOC_008554 [Tetrabaena socialis]|uniref:Uncharacterized protein n=1 Tax=Tetrabaena socialis TaxID=47790 RepID=A0A2J7ZY02_9CHLO|nr:hypothetical protein TSOC_008554 [Tetrabaena socialis]|eukprot:PNH05149.1 hypothetical protein TSOC_008554 [Tetrabaena socialis]